MRYDFGVSYTLRMVWFIYSEMPDNIIMTVGDAGTEDDAFCCIMPKIFNTQILVECEQYLTGSHIYLYGRADNIRIFITETWIYVDV